MAIKPIKRGQKLRMHAANSALRAMDLIINSDVRNRRHNVKFPKDVRVLFSDAPGVEEAIETILGRSYQMKTGNTILFPD